jgi:hypothetical protein
MALDSTQLVIAPFGHVYTAPSATTQPTDVVAAWPAGWVELGYTTDTGVAITPGMTVVNLLAWQASAPVKTMITGSSLDLAFALRQFNGSTSGLYFFGGAWTLSSGSTYKMSIVSSPPVNERMLGIEWSDGTTTNRLIIPRGMVSKHDNIVLDRKEATIFGVTFSALDSAGVLGTILSNSANLP